MGTTWAIFKKELAGYFNSPIAYIFVVLFLLLTTGIYFLQVFLSSYAHISGFFSLLPWLLIILVPALTMRLWAEERKIGTDELLLTLPVRSYHLVFGKYLACLGLVAFALACTLSVPLTIGWLGNLDPGPVIGGYVGALLMGGAYLAMGLFVSSLTTNQILAFILALVGCASLILVNLLSPVLPDPLVPIAQYLSIESHFASIALGQIDSRDLVYFLSFVVFFLYANIASLEARKW